ncbi:LOW QUALITY PROTEIN: hypothetical protein PanWU01x14_080660 [Parasponia andersonii]|uniref:Uncharacterized protein n=1 Tax=Parasponia andersonii TaxID=3476 RepID=A0A2P5DAT8_PARAD|nr:LOW QUALITY PROTEIN: hypothetical protein PanWU01x14_080660 [Parasponia andersonii]
MAPRLGKTRFILTINPGSDVVLHGLSIRSFLGPVPILASPLNPNSNTIFDLASNSFDIVERVGIRKRVSEGFKVEAMSKGERSREGKVSKVQHLTDSTHQVEWKIKP